MWAGAEEFVLAGGSDGGFIALDYAILHGDKLLGLILRDTRAYGVMGMMTALANVLTSDRVKVDVARQVRTWSGNLYDDQDFQDSFAELEPVYEPPKSASMLEAGHDTTVSVEFGGSANRRKRSAFNSATQNAAFSINMPHFDVRHRLTEIQVKKSYKALSTLLQSLLIYMLGFYPCDRWTLGSDLFGRV